MPTKVSVTNLYRLWHIPSGKCYIGKTGLNLFQSFNRHWSSGWCRQIDEDKNNWLMEPIARLVELAPLSRESTLALQGAIDNFIRTNGQELLLCPVADKTKHGNPIQAMNARNIELGFPGAKALSRPVTLFHPDHGLCQAESRSQFARIYGLSVTKVSEVVNGYVKSTKGWRLPSCGDE